MALNATWHKAHPMPKNASRPALHHLAIADLDVLLMATSPADLSFRRYPRFS